jgi:anti-sigma-K factor RskA
MKDNLNISRYEELAAGQSLADLDPAERAEWARLGGADDDGLAEDLEAISAHLEIAAASKAATPLPPALAQRLTQHARSLAAAPQATQPLAADRGLVALPSPDQASRPRTSWLSSPGPGWAVAACLAGILAAQWMIKPDATENRPPSPSVARAMLLENAPDLVRVSFQGAGGDYELAGGDVVWSDSLQEGYMTLEHIPANQPTEAQYQLWIVDPDRDEIPVDGGVFDIPAADGPVVVPINSKLPVSDPAAFVITLEQPGGVVRSKQETVVAIAKPGE